MAAIPQRPKDSLLISHTDYIEALFDYLGRCPISVYNKEERLNDICAICHEKIIGELSSAYDGLLSKIKKVESNGNISKPTLDVVHEFEGMLELVVRKSPTAALGKIEDALNEKRSWEHHNIYSSFFVKLESLREYLMDLPSINCH